jgi:RNA polymerase sigma-70 factor (ECF subfamily)
LHKRVTSKEVAEDLTSEIFEKVYKTINDFQWQGVTLSAWLFRIARNHLIDYYRKNNKFKNDTSLDEIIDIVVSNSTPIEKQIEESETEVNLFKSISELEQEDQYLIYYKFYEEMSNKQISELTGISETNIGTKLHRIRKKLAKHITKYENTK